MTTQVFNDEMMNLIATDFQRRYEPNFAWSNTMSMYLQLPGLIGFWPGNVGISTSTNSLRDMSGAGQHLSPGAPAPEGADSSGLRRWNEYNGTTRYFSLADTVFNSILGTEAGVAASIRGLTVMAWVRPASAIGSNEVIASKYQSSGSQISWVILRRLTGPCRFQVSGNGSTVVTVDSTNDIDQNEWRFIAGRFTPSTQIRVWEGFTYGLVTNENTTSIPASLHNSTESLAVGALNTSTTPGSLWNGDLSLIALCRAALPDLFIDSIFDLTRPLFIRR